MRVLYVVHQFYPQFVSGTEQYVLALARAGRCRGDDVRVFTVDPDFANVEPPRETAHYVFQGVPVVRYRFDKAAVRNHVLTDYHNPEVGESFCECLDEFRPEVVHFFHFRWLGLDRLDEVRERGIPTVVNLMDFWFACPNFLLLRPGGVLCDGPPDGGLGCFDCVHQGIAEWAREPWAREQHALRQERGEGPSHETSGEAAGYAMTRRARILADALAKADLVLAPSRTVRDVLARAGARSDRTELAPYGVEKERLVDLAPPPSDRVVVGFVGTLAPHKGTDLLLEAFRTLEDEVELQVHGRFGDFPEFDARLQELAKGEARVRFAGGFARAELGRVLGGLHILVVPSVWRENTPFVCLEGRAAGVRLLVSDLDGLAEAVPEECGRTFPTGSVEGLGRALADMVQEVREAGFQRLPPDSRIESMPEQYETFRRRYQSLSV